MLYRHTTAFKILTPFGGQVKILKHKVTDIIIKGTFSRDYCYAEYESVIGNAKFALLFCTCLPMAKYHQSTPQYYKLGTEKSKRVVH